MLCLTVSNPMETSSQVQAHHMKVEWFSQSSCLHLLQARLLSKYPQVTLPNPTATVCPAALLSSPRDDYNLGSGWLLEGDIKYTTANFQQLLFGAMSHHGSLDMRHVRPSSAVIIDHRVKFRQINSNLSFVCACYCTVWDKFKCVLWRRRRPHSSSYISIFKTQSKQIGVAPRSEMELDHYCTRS